MRSWSWKKSKSRSLTRESSKQATLLFVPATRVSFFLGVFHAMGPGYHHGSHACVDHVLEVRTFVFSALASYAGGVGILYKIQSGTRNVYIDIIHLSSVQIMQRYLIPNLLSLHIA